jgi:hypothetical protein
METIATKSVAGNQEDSCDCDFCVEDVVLIREGRDGPINIGVGRCAASRLRELQACNPRELVLLGFYAATRGRARTKEWIHLLQEHHIHDGWFHPAPDVLAAVEATLITEARRRQL